MNRLFRLNSGCIFDHSNKGIILLFECHVDLLLGDGLLSNKFGIYLMLHLLDPSVLFITLFNLQSDQQ